MLATTRPTCRRRIMPVRHEEATVLSRAVAACEVIPAKPDPEHRMALLIIGEARGSCYTERVVR